MDHTAPAFIATATRQHLFVLGINPATDKAQSSAAARDMRQRGGLEAWHQSPGAYADWYRKVSHKAGGHLRQTPGGLDRWAGGLERLRALAPDAGAAPYMGPQDVEVSSLARGMLATRGLTLLGFDKSGADQGLLAAAGEDFLEDPSLRAALAGSASAFREWWARDDASIYCLTDETGSEDWAIGVLARVPNVWPHALPD